MPVDHIHPDYSATAPLWLQCRDAVAGEYRVHAAGVRYLPRLAEESQSDYSARVNRAPFVGVSGRTLDGLVGLVLRKDPVLTVPAGFERYLDDVDLAGQGFPELLEWVVRETLTAGRCGVLVDYPAGGGQATTVAEAEGAGSRPTLTRYPVESVINWRYGAIGSRTMLELVVLKELADVGGDEFQRQHDVRYRVLDLDGGAGYRQRVMDRDGVLLEEIFPLRNGSRIPEIPFDFVGLDGVPPLLDLVTLNFHHYRVSADYEHGCHFSGLPTLFISGHDPAPGDAPIYLGGPTANALRSEGAKAYFVEITSNFAALRANLDGKEKLMAVLGSRMLEVQRPGVEAAETASIHRRGEESLLAGIAKAIDRGVLRVLRRWVEWGGGDPGTVEFALNRDYETNRLSAQELTALVAAWQAGAFSRQTLHFNLQSGEIVPDGVEFEDEQARIEGEGPKNENPTLTRREDNTPIGGV